MYLELGLNILLIVLLLPTLVYVVLLHRRLSSLRADREAVDAVVERMNEATRRADAALKGLRQTAEQAKTTRSEERRVGKECVSPCRSRWSPYHEKKNSK